MTMTDAEWNECVEACAVAATQQDRTGREWVGNSLWANILKRAGDEVRKLKRPERPEFAALQVNFVPNDPRFMAAAISFVVDARGCGAAELQGDDVDALTFLEEFQNGDLSAYPEFLLYCERQGLPVGGKPIKGGE